MLPLEYVNKLQKAGLELAEPFKGLTSLHHNIKCLLCLGQFNATLKSKVQNFKNSGLRGCPTCTTSKRYEAERNRMREKIAELGFEVTDFETKGDTIIARNLNCKCGRSWTTKPTYILSGRSFCKPCNDETKASRMRECNEVKHKTAISGLSEFKAYKKKVMVLSNRVYRENVERFPVLRSRENHLDHIIPISFCYKSDIPEEICASICNLRVIPANDNVKKNTKIPQIVPPEFRKYIKSSAKVEAFVAELAEINGGIEFGSVVAGIDTTAFDPLKRLAIFLLPLNENVQGVVGGRHSVSKIKLAMTQAGMRCLIYFEDEWDTRREVILSKIRYMYHDAKRVFARRCRVDLVESSEKGEFLANNHIQGDDRSSICYGLYLGGELLALMSFSKPKVFMKGRRYNTDAKQYELSRFCVKGGVSIPGAASRLLARFKRDIEYDEIYSFADRRVSDGNLYEILGFKREKMVEIDYSYVIDNKRKHRWDFRKDRIKEKFPHVYDSAKTEYQMMLELGIDRVWDAGKIRYRIDK
jgi:hypothetical protein